MIKLGDLAFFRRAKTMLKGDLVNFKGTGYGMFLGHVPRGVAEPPGVLVLLQLGEAGFFPIADIENFLGEAALKEFTAKFLDKYYGPVRSELDDSFKKQQEPVQNVAETYGHTEAVIAEAPDIIARPPLQLVGPTGRPISSGTPTDGE